MEIEAEPDFLRDRWVRVLADAMASGVWYRDGSDGHPDDLPITEELRQRILAWQDWYDRLAPQVPGEDPSLFDIPSFAAEGLGIARAVKGQLADWTVIYWDEQKSSEIRARRQPWTDEARSYVEYEIGSHQS